MAVEQAGLMAETNHKRNQIMDQIRKAFGPTRTKPLSLQERLEGLTPEKLEFVMNIASLVKIASAFDKRRSYAELVDSMYGTLEPSLRRLIADMLQDADPIQEPTEAKPDLRVAAREQIIKDYASMSILFPPKEATPESFMAKMAMSESSGR